MLEQVENDSQTGEKNWANLSVINLHFDTPLFTIRIGYTENKRAAPTDGSYDQIEYGMRCL